MWWEHITMTALQNYAEEEFVWVGGSWSTQEDLQEQTTQPFFFNKHAAIRGICFVKIC